MRYGDRARSLGGENLRDPRRPHGISDQIPDEEQDQRVPTDGEGGRHERCSVQDP